MAREAKVKVKVRFHGLHAARRKRLAMKRELQGEETLMPFVGFCYLRHSTFFYKL